MGCPPQPPEREPAWASRAAAKLLAALETFQIDVTGLTCADFGCHAGGFTDCLLRHGAARVYALDTAYGVLEWRLRQDPRVVVMERTNVLHAEPPEPVDLVTIDAGWTRQRHVIPAALRWLAPGGRIISLVKPHYELEADEKRNLLRDGVLEPAVAERVANRVIDAMAGLGARVVRRMISPVAGAKSARRKGSGGNREYLVLALAEGGPGSDETAPETGSNA